MASMSNDSLKRVVVTGAAGFIGSTLVDSLLQQGIEVLGIDRVEFRADATNAKSIAAMKKIGCTVEGVLRSHFIRFYAFFVENFQMYPDFITSVPSKIP